MRGEEYTAPRGPIPGCAAPICFDCHTPCIAAILLIKPSYISDAIGLVLLALVFVVQKLSVDAKRRSAG